MNIEDAKINHEINKKLLKDFIEYLENNQCVFNETASRKLDAFVEGFDKETEIVDTAVNEALDYKEKYERLDLITTRYVEKAKAALNCKDF